MVRLSTATLRALRARPTAPTRFVGPAVTGRSFHLTTTRSNAASSAAQAPTAGAGLQGNVDLMTGEVIRTADIDVSLPSPPSLSTFGSPSCPLSHAQLTTLAPVSTALSSRD